MDKCKEEFEKWYGDNGDYVEEKDYKAWCNYAFTSGWQARQSEIDALKAQVEELKAAIEKIEDEYGYTGDNGLTDAIATAYNKAIQQPKGEELKAERYCFECDSCPFCGSNNISAGEIVGTHLDGTHFVQTACLNCGASSPEASSELESVKLWNKRVKAIQQPKGEEDDSIN